MFASQRIPYHQTNSFSKIVLHYLDGAEALKPFYSFPPNLEGIKNAIEEKKKQTIDRATLVQELKKQYVQVAYSEAVEKNIALLEEANTFTITTAHQPNLFTGPLYVLYKILHTIKLSSDLKQQFQFYNFVPVFYMGSEDADLAELNHTFVTGTKLEWGTRQTGAVGRMIIDKDLLRLIDSIEGQLSVQPYGKEVIDLIRACYTEGKNIQTATFEIIHALFARYGLVVLLPDNAVLKRQMHSFFDEDLFHQTSSSIVAEQSAALEEHYKVQANPRHINLFYLKDNIRERIVKTDNGFHIHNTNIQFTDDEIKRELQEHPERFSPNVILRGLFQETILPNIAFIGGGGELAYWLQLKTLFTHYSVPFPLLVLRNSFVLVEKETKQLLTKLKLSFAESFLPELSIMNLLIERQGKMPKLNGELNKVEEVYGNLHTMASSVDSSLLQHVAALKAKTMKQLLSLEKKMQRAERQKQEATRNKISRLKQQMFPNNNLQERVNNFSMYYAQWGSHFIGELYEHSLSLEQEFVVLEEA